MATILRGLLFLRNSPQASAILRQQSCVLAVQNRPKGYYVLLPEIPDDTPETNSLLRVTDEIPQYTDTTGESAYRAMGKLIIEYEAGLTALERKLEDPNYPKTFESVFDPIEKLVAPMESAWSALQNLYAVRGDEDIGRAYNRLNRRVRAAHMKRFISPQIYRVVRDLRGDINKFDGDQKQVIEKFYQNAKRVGLDLDENSKEVQRGILQNIMSQADQFEKKLAIATNLFKQPLDKDSLKHFPPHLIQNFATQNGFVATLHEPQYSTFMAYCGDRLHRWNIFNARSIRASITNKDTNNSIHIEEIRSDRQQEAQVFGFPNYAEMSISTKMAPSLYHVQMTLHDLSKKLGPVAKSQLESLAAFCAEKGFKAPLERWDLPYWGRRQRETRFCIEENDMRELFPLESVLQGICNLTNHLFGVEMYEVQPETPLWVPDVKMFKLALDGKELGTILMDLQARGNKCPGTSCIQLKTRSAVNNMQPIFSIVMGLHNSTSLTLNELSELLKNMGLAIQHNLSKSRYTDSSAFNWLPSDMSQMTSELFNMLLLDVRFARMLSAGEALPDDYHNKIVENRLQLCAVDLQLEIYRSLLDLELYCCKEYWKDVVKRIYPAIVTSFPFNQHDALHVCSFSEIITGNLQAAYYSKVWSRMVAAEVFQTICQGTTEEEAVKAAKRFRDSLLLDAGSVEPLEAFRRFQGRDPTADSLLAVCSMKTAPTTGATQSAGQKNNKNTSVV